MNISRCRFMPPIREKEVAECLVIINGIMMINVTIYRNQNIRLKESVLEVEWPIDVLILDEYSRRCLDNEILDRYSEWRYEENEKI